MTTFHTSYYTYYFVTLGSGSTGNYIALNEKKGKPEKISYQIRRTSRSSPQQYNFAVLKYFMKNLGNQEFSAQECASKNGTELFERDVAQRVLVLNVLRVIPFTKS